MCVRLFLLAWGLSEVKHRPLVLVGLLALPLFVLPAQSTDYFGRHIVTIEYVPAKQPLDPADLTRCQLLKPGQPLRSEDVAETIDRLFATRAYLDIQVDAELRGSGVVIRFLTTPAIFIGHISFIGKIDSPPNRSQLLSAMQMNTGTPFKAEMLKDAELRLMQLFKANGLYEASENIASELNSDTQQVNITVYFSPGKRARYQDPVIHGDAILPESTIVRATGWKVRIINRWRDVTASLTQSGLTGIQKKYQDKDRLEATVQMENLAYNPQTRQVIPTLTLDAGPIIKVAAAGAKVSKGRLKKYVPVYQEGTVDRDLLTEGARNLRDYFQARGYPDVDVTFREEPEQNGQQTIEYYVSKGDKKKLVHLGFEGNKYFTDETLEERMFLKPKSIQFFHGRYSEGFRARDEEAIANLYKANGFRDVKVASFVTDNFHGKSDQIAVTFRITEGSQWTVAKLVINGVNRMSREAVESRLTLSPGQPYSDVNVASDRNSLMTLYSTQGFASASFQYSVRESDQPNQVELTYDIVEGQQQFVRDVLVMGLQRTHPDVVTKKLTFAAGDPLSMVSISETQRRLYNLGIFSRIDAGIQNPAGDETRKHVFFDIGEARRYTVNIGIGADLARFGRTTTDLSSPAGTTGFSPRVSFDVSRINFLGSDHTITLRTRLSDIRQLAALTYLDPNFLGREGQNLIISGLYDNSRDVQTFASRRLEASIGVSRRLSKPSTLSLQFAYRRVSTSDVVIPSLLISPALQPARVGILSMTYVQDRRDNPADPHRGIYNTVNVGLASKFFGSQVNFTKTLGRNATYTPFGKNFVFARQTTFGVITPYNYPSDLNEVDAIPLPEKYFGGGSITHRGFPENQAGPRDIGVSSTSSGTVQATGFPVGGNVVLFNNLELRFPLFGENIGGVLFEDSGNVYDTFGDISFRYHQTSRRDFSYMAHAVGFGIRYKTPVGPVRVDLAYTLNPTQFNGFKGSFQDLLQCNPNLPPSQLPSFCVPVPQSTGHFQFFFSIGQTF
jgi:outer membrane protein insertion porin family